MKKTDQAIATTSDGNEGSLPSTVQVLGIDVPEYIKVVPISEKLTTITLLMDNYPLEEPHSSGSKSDEYVDEHVQPLKHRPEFIQHVQDNLWDNRRDRGIAWRKNVFDFIDETYGDKAESPEDNWISKGMVLGDLIGLDDALYKAINNQRERRPPGFKLLSEAEAAIQKISDPNEKERLRVAREVLAERVAASRERRARVPKASSKPPSP